MTSSEATRHHVSEFTAPTLIGTLLRAYPRTTIAWVHLSFCVPLQLSATNAMGSPEGSPHIVDLGPGADTAVLEYQPVVHRLRLAASP
jgi:hypothetical protein